MNEPNDKTIVPSVDDVVLLPCPFCGGQAVLEDHRLVWAVICPCGASVIGERALEPDREMTDEYWLQFKKSAIDRWNSRSGQ